MLDYKSISLEARKTILRLIYKAQVSHVGSNLSVIDILAVLFEIIDLDKDKFILSKGWAAASLYYFLWRKGKITEEELNSFCQPKSKFIGLAEPIIPEIPFAGGSMGYGLPAGVGFALAKKLKKEKGNIYVLMSDGEMQCGTTWETALIAAHHKLDNLIVIVDYNKFQAMGKTNELLDIESLVDKWESFNWIVRETDGHNYKILRNRLSWINRKPENKFFGSYGRPYILIAHTIKGKGISFMENNNLYHYKQISFIEYDRTTEMLDAATQGKELIL